MLRPESSMQPTPPARPALRPVPAPQSGEQPGFGALFREVSREVADFIEHGSRGGTRAASSAATFAPPALDAAGQVVRDALLSRPAAGAHEAPGQADQAVAGRRYAPSGTVFAARDLNPGQATFLEAIADAARDAGQRLGVRPELVAAHAALESGWGHRPLRHPDGRSTHNLFGIKAGAGWDGEVVHAPTTEFENGAAVGRSDAFRSYPDAQSAFRDYARLLATSPRYRAALGAGGDARAFADALSRGGYATDPAFADRLARVAARLLPGE